MTKVVDTNQDDRGAGRPHVVIVGAGFGGLSAAKALSKADVDITLIDRRNHHLFQPLLYQVATAALAPNQIASPIRSIVRKQRNVSVILDEVISINRHANQIILRDRAIAFDYLVVATGARQTYFGRDEWERHAPGLKNLDDANGIRERILLAFERAELLPSGPARAQALTFVIIGGGPTGVELAGAVAELAKRALACDFRHTRCTDPRVVLIEAGARLLPTFSPPISDYVRRSLEKRGVEVRLGSPVKDCADRLVKLGDEDIPAETIIWAAGVRSSPAAEWLSAPADRAGRAQVRADLSIEGADNIFIVGDAACVLTADGVSVPGLAPAAKQQGAYVGRLIGERTAGQSMERPFRYLDFGSLATIGRNSAVAEIGSIRLTGFVAWLFWSAIHVYFLIGFRNRILVTLDWLWSYFTLERGARLITGAPQRLSPSTTGFQPMVLPAAE